MRATELKTDHQSPPTITVWVHGTQLFRRPLFHSFFEGKASLKKAADLESSYKLRTIADTLYTSAPELFPLEHFYLFGWSGKLSSAEHERAAIALHHELQQLITTYKKTYNTPPFIQIITHSHGGNVALNVAKVKQQEKTDFVIDRLVLLACPVQRKTVEYIKSLLFKKVYTLYSSLDLVQIIAPQVIHKITETKKGKLKSEYTIPIFSHRRFPVHDNVSQVKIRINSRAILHREFNRPTFLSLLPRIIELIDIWNTQELRNIPITNTTQLLCVYTPKHTLLYDAK